MQHDGLVGTVGERHDRLQPQQVVAAHRRQCVEPGGQRGPGDRPLAGDTKGANAVVVPVDVRLFVGVIRIVMVRVVALECLVAQPAPHIDTLGRGVEEAEVKEQSRIDGALCDRHDRSARIEAAEPVLDDLPRARLGEISFGQQQAVGHRRLLDRLGLPVERAGAVDGIDRRHDPVEHIARRDDRFGHQGVQDRRRVGEAGGLDRDAREERDLTLDPIDKEVGQGVDDVIAHGAAQAAAVEQHHILARTLDEQMVEANLAEFVDDDRRRRHAGLFQHVVEHGCLAAAEKAGQQGYRDQRGRFIRVHMTAHSQHATGDITFHVLQRYKPVPRGAVFHSRRVRPQRRGGGTPDPGRRLVQHPRGHRAPGRGR